ncbi:MAG: hypothetical protein JZU50_01000 [Desulfobulbaceae bacterium]|nr:hypothetical protein [Desulfobulbaceae bacterium]
MKKVLVAGAALMLAGGIYASAASAAAVEPGVKVTGDARARIYTKSAEYYNNYGNIADPSTGHYSDSNEMDSRVRFNIKGTAAGGAYAFVRIRAMENLMGDMDRDTTETNNLTQNNLWADQAFMGIPFTDAFTVELGKFRSTYGPLGATNNFFYDDVNMAGGRATFKTGNLEINPFIVWMDEAKNTNTGVTYLPPTVPDQNGDNDEMRYAAHLKYQVSKAWTLGGMLGYQADDRREWAVVNNNYPAGVTQNSGGFGSIYVNGKSGQIGVVGELGVNAADLNGFNTWYEDANGDRIDSVGSNDTGFGGYIMPSYTIDKLTLALNGGFTDGGFLPDRAYGFVMVGGLDNSVIVAQQIGAGDDWLWLGLCPSYQFNESLKLTGNIVYADVDPWTSAGDGPGFSGGTNLAALESAMELSAVLQYTISKGMNLYLSAGYLDPSFEYINVTRTTNPELQEDARWGTNARFELAF